MTKNESPLERMRRIEADHEPPTESESWDYVHVLTSTNAPLPKRRDLGNLLMWLLVFATFAFLSGSVFAASRGAAQGNALGTCTSKLSNLVNPKLMSSTTATRKARKVCQGLSYGAPSFYKALTQ